MEFSTTAIKSEKLRIEPVFSSEISGIEHFSPERFRIILVQKGNTSAEINGSQFMLFAPCIICLNENDRIALEKPDAVKARTFYFHPRFLNKKLNFENIRQKGMDTDSEVIENRMLLRPFIRNERYSFIVQIAPESAKRIDNLMESARIELTEQPSGWWPCRTRSFLTELLFLTVQLVESAKPEKIAENRTKKMDNVPDEFKKILNFIMENYNQKLTLEGLSRQFGTNRTALNEKFKAMTGLSVISYIIDLRLRIATTLLKDTDLPVAEIAERTGFSDSTHFERAFKKKYELTPALYRKKL